MSALTGTAIAALIAGGIGTTASLVGAHMQAGAAKDAAATEAASAQKAGDYVQHATDQSLAYIDASRNAARQAPTYQAPRPMIPGATVQPFSAQPQTQPMGAPTMAPNMGAGLSTSAAPQPVAGAPQATILVQAPDGSQRRVPAALRDRVVQAGGKILG